MTDVIALIDEATDDEVDRAGKVASSEALIRAKDIECWCANEPRVDLCPSCEAYDYGLYVGPLASIVAARLGVEITTREVEGNRRGRGRGHVRTRRRRARGADRGLAERFVPQLRGLHIDIRLRKGDCRVGNGSAFSSDRRACFHVFRGRAVAMPSHDRVGHSHCVEASGDSFDRGNEERARAWGVGSPTGRYGRAGHVPAGTDGVGNMTNIEDIFRKWFGRSDTSERILELTEGSYSEPWRHYHTFQHIRSCVDALHPYQHRSDYPEMFLALLWHDVVYIPGNSSNEALSAEIALMNLGNLELGSLVNAELVSKLIRSTKTHDSRDEQCSLVCSIDMHELADPGKYWTNRDLVRQEFSMFTDDEWTQGRISFLESLDEPFRHPDFAHLNEPAMLNVRQELHELLATKRDVE